MSYVILYRDPTSGKIHPAVLAEARGAAEFESEAEARAYWPVMRRMFGLPDDTLRQIVEPFDL